jgi:hypothetical protein
MDSTNLDCNRRVSQCPLYFINLVLLWADPCNKAKQTSEGFIV